jgi:hypothetical protein
MTRKTQSNLADDLTFNLSNGDIQIIVDGLRKELEVHPQNAINGRNPLLSNKHAHVRQLFNQFDALLNNACQQATVNPRF